MGFCKVEVRDFVATITYDRPPVNATFSDAYDEIRDTIYALELRDDIKVVILTGAGKCFMAGNDLGEFGEFGTREKCVPYFDKLRNAYMAVKNCKYPTIGAINGAAFGAGLIFASCFDMLVASEKAKFSLAEIKVGIVGGDGFLSMLAPEKVVNYMALTGNPLTAAELARYGGIHKVVPHEELMSAAYALAGEITPLARRALLVWKENLKRNTRDNRLEEKFFSNLQGTLDFQPYHDFTEASKAFLEKREPQYDNK